MIIQIPKDIDDTKAKIVKGLSIEQGISVMGMGAVLVTWIATGRKLPTPLLIATLVFIGFLGFFEYQRMNGLKFFIVIIKHFITGTSYLFEKMFSKTTLTKKEQKKINQKLEKERKMAKKKNLSYIEPVVYASTKNKGRRK